MIASIVRPSMGAAEVLFLIAAIVAGIAFVIEVLNHTGLSTVALVEVALVLISVGLLFR